MSGPMANRPGTAEVWCVKTSTLTGLLREISQPGEIPSSRAVGPRNERLALDPIRTSTTEAYQGKIRVTYTCLYDVIVAKENKYSAFCNLLP